MSIKNQIQELLKEAWRLRVKSDEEGSRALLFEAKRLCDDKDHSSLGRIHHILMQLEYDRNDYEQALSFNAISVTHYRQDGDADRIAHSLRHRADLLRQIGNVESSLEHYAESIRIYRDNLETSEIDLANALRGYALILQLKGDLLKAIDIWKETMDLYEVVGINAGVEEAEEMIRQLTDDPDLKH